MWKDPIVEALHRTREAMLAECGGDLLALAAAANARDAASKAAAARVVAPSEKSEPRGVVRPA